MDVTEFVSYLFWSFFKWLHDVLMFEVFYPTLLCHTGFIYVIS